MKRCFTLALLAGWLAAVQVNPAQAEVTSISAWQHLPVLDNGRVMPLDSYARHLLLGFSGKSTLDRKPAALWLARVLFTPEDCREDTIFLVDHPEVVQALGLPAEGRDRYSYAQLEPHLDELNRLARAAFNLDENLRSPVETGIMRLFNHLILYQRLTESLAFTVPRPEFDIAQEDLRRDLDVAPDQRMAPYDILARKDRIEALLKLSPASTGPLDAYQQELRRLGASLRMWIQRRDDLPPSMIPPPGALAGQPWLGPWEALNRSEGQQDLAREVKSLHDLAVAFRGGQQEAFDLAARALAGSVAGRMPDPKPLSRLQLEVQYNQSDAFYCSELLYGSAFLLALLSVPFRGRWLYGAACLLIGLALVPHTYGIIARMLIMNRPPVTNLYTTFVFVSWMCALIGLTLELLQRNRLGLITASSMGLSLLMTAARFGSEGDTMGVMVAVLDSNFWLATHVVTISIGYAGCCASGLLGHFYLLQALRRTPDDPGLKETDRAVYGAQAFGLIFTFLGTMLGGVWADQSWGRFWGWDPKENGALVIVLWSAVLFHARLAGLIGARGFAAGSVLGIIGVLLAWLGVNLLNVGLHAYGFTSGIARGLAISCGAEILFVLLVTPWARKQTEAARVDVPPGS